MMPPICKICDEDFRTSEGGLIYFAESEQDIEDNKHFKEPGFVGHPSNAVWFCETHLKLAKPFENLTRAVAMPKILEHLNLDK